MCLATALLVLGLAIPASADVLYADVLLSDSGISNSIASPNTSRNVAVDASQRRAIFHRAPTARKARGGPLGRLATSIVWTRWSIHGPGGRVDDHSARQTVELKEAFRAAIGMMEDAEQGGPKAERAHTELRSTQQQLLEASRRRGCRRWQPTFCTTRRNRQPAGLSALMERPGVPVKREDAMETHKRGNGCL